MKLFGVLIIIAFIFYLVMLINEGPYIFGGGEKYFINIKNLEFSITGITIHIGDVIEFINYDDVRHTIIVNSETIPNSKLLHKYDSYEHVFRYPGIYEFNSSLYSMDKCVVTVIDAPKGKAFYKNIGENIKKIFTHKAGEKLGAYMRSMRAIGEDVQHKLIKAAGADLEIVNRKQPTKPKKKHKTVQSFL